MNNNVEIKRFGKKFGVANFDGKAQLSFELLTPEENIDLLQENNTFITDRITRDGVTIAPNGARNNLPGELAYHVGRNSSMPQILRKQATMLYGQGPYLYQTDFNGDNNLVKIWSARKNHPQVFAWLESWRANGLAQSFQEYLKSVALNYYYTEDYFSFHVHNKSRIVNGSLPVRGLEHLKTVRGRLATDSTIPGNVEIQDYMLNLVCDSEWRGYVNREIKFYDRYDYSNPFKSAISVNYIKDASFADSIYSIPTYYAGLLDLIKGSNLNPKYINSFLMHSFSAKIHCIIPDAWFRDYEEKFKDACNENINRENSGTQLLEKLEGVKLINDAGEALEYSFDMVQQILDKRIQNLTTVMSGAGKNQGKIFYSKSYANEVGTDSEWQFKEIPTKYKEFMDAISSYDDLVLKRILTGLGVDPAISNVSSEGVFNNSGSQVYYNYLIYLHQLNWAEEMIFADLNEAIKLNFPSIYNEGFRLSCYRDIPQRLEDTSVKDRIQNQPK